MPKLLITFTLLLLASGCTHVAPYEREDLARPGMDNGEREAPYHSFVAHIIEAREGAGAVGLAESSGGGCGCN